MKEALVKKNQLTGDHQAVRLIDGTIRRFPVAKIIVDSPYFEGEIEAVCMPDCLSEVVIGNVKGARDPNDPNLHWVPKKDVCMSESDNTLSGVAVQMIVKTRMLRAQFQMI